MRFPAARRAKTDPCLGSVAGYPSRHAGLPAKGRTPADFASFFCPFLPSVSRIDACRQWIDEVDRGPPPGTKHQKPEGASRESMNPADRLTAVHPELANSIALGDGPKPSREEHFKARSRRPGWAVVHALVIVPLAAPVLAQEMDTITVAGTSTRNSHRRTRAGLRPMPSGSSGPRPPRTFGDLPSSYRGWSEIDTQMKR